RVAEGLGLLPLRQRLLDVLARDLAGAEKDLVDRVGAVVRARREHVARLEVEDLDDAVLLEAERAGEMLAPKLDEALDDIDIANLPFQSHARDYRASRVHLGAQSLPVVSPEHIHQILHRGLLHAAHAADSLDQQPAALL